MFFLISPAFGDQSFAEVAGNAHLVRMILYRHYQRHGGLILPPRAEAQQVVQAHVAALQTARQQGVPEGQLPRIAFPRW